MKDRYWLTQHRGVFYAMDSETRKKQSLRTRSKSEARRLLAAKNESARQPQLNLAMAKTYLSAHDPRMAERVWLDVMDEFCTHGKPSSQERSKRAMRSRDFDPIRNRKLVETAADDLLTILKTCGAATNNYLRRVHNLALGLGWLSWPVLAPKLWPKPTPKSKRGITAEEHEKLITATKNDEWRFFFEVLWETGASQSDAANLKAEDIDWEDKRLIYNRQKLKEVYAPAVISIGPRLETVLRQLPEKAFLFPKIQQTSWNHRAAEFYRKCKVLKIEGVSLHSYRYSWAERAKAAGYPERWAQANLGHNSRAVHQCYAKKAVVECPSLEDYERQAQGKIIRLAG